MSKKMRALINGQTLRIDNHKRGDGTEIKFRPGIHIHKIMNNDRYSGANIELPLNENEGVKIIAEGNRKTKDRLWSEIKRAFKDAKKRTAFVKDMIDELDRKCTFNDDAERLQAYITSANKIAQHFGLIDMTKPIMKNTKDIFKTIHTDENGKLYYILQDIKGKNIIIGDSQDMIDNWETINWNIVK